MRVALIILLIANGIIGRSQTWSTDSLGSYKIRKEINLKTVGDLPDSVDLPLGTGLFHTRFAKTVLQGVVAWGDITSKPTTTSWLSNSTNKNFVTDAHLTILGNTSGTNSGDNAVNSLYSGLVSNATHTGDATGSTALTVVKINGVSLAGLGTGILKNTTGTGVPSIAVSGTDIKTVNSTSLLGSGDVAVQATLVSGTNIKTINSGSILGSGDLTLQPTDADLTTIAGLTATTDNFIQSKGSAWASRTIAQVSADLFLPVYARVTGSNFTTTGQALTNITGLSVALTTNATYEIEAVLSVSTTAVTTGTQYGVQYSVAGGAVEAQVKGPLTSTADQTVRLNALNTATVAFLTTSAQTGGILIKGIVTTGANAGSLTIQTLKVTSGTSTVFINSYLKVTRIL